jgi:hypothetical protein
VLGSGKVDFVTVARLVRESVAQPAKPKAEWVAVN